MSVSDDSAPEEAEVGSATSATVTVSELYTDAPGEWTLRAESNFTGTVDWQISKKKFGNAGVDNESASGSSFETTINREQDETETVTVSVSGTVPEIDQYSYENRQNVTAVTIYRVSDGEKVELGTTRIEYFTNESKNAREAIDSARQAINDTGGNAEAERSLEQAISAYNSGNFENAVSNAEDAESTANSAAQSQQTTQLLMYGGVAAVVLVVVVGGVWYWRNQQDDYDKLR
ncbi:hypothetical protein [Halorientalis salina]|uniref:hypothetical protein n=1 Tax=Halorientalis salina TaxID=2932266 RepID=UPI0010ACBD68|nr:hypothetical protein [Halorientalis salina]